MSTSGGVKRHSLLFVLSDCDFTALLLRCSVLGSPQCGASLQVKGSCSIIEFRVHSCIVKTMCFVSNKYAREAKDGFFFRQLIPPRSALVMLQISTGPMKRNLIGPMYRLDLG